MINKFARKHLLMTSGKFYKKIDDGLDPEILEQNPEKPYIDETNINTNTTV